MGYSCSTAAGKTLDKLDKTAFERYGISNGLPNGGFYEYTRREHADGRITGTVWRGVGNNLVRKAGTFTINPDGTLQRFPGWAIKALGFAVGDNPGSAWAQYIKKQRAI